MSVRHLTEQKVADLLLQALREACPERAAAGCSVSFPTFNVTGLDDESGEPYMAADIVGGGMGGHVGGDGISAVDTHMGNCAMMSAEALEVEAPLRVLRTELVPDSGGAGEHRGGLALERWYQLLAEEASVSGRYADQTLEETRPWGAQGGLPGARAAVLLDPGGPQEREIPGQGRGPAAAARRHLRAALERRRRLGRPAAARREQRARRPARRLHHTGTGA